MAIKIVCENPACRKTLRIKEESAGKRIKCPACARVLSVPAQEQPSGFPHSSSSKNLPVPDRTFVTGTPLDRAPTTSRKAVLALVCGFLGLPLCVCATLPVAVDSVSEFLLSLPLLLLPCVPAIMAVVLGRSARRRIGESHGKLSGRGLTTAALVCGIGSIGVGITLASVVVVGRLAFPERWEQSEHRARLRMKNLFGGDAEPDSASRYRWKPAGYPEGLDGADGVSVKEIVKDGKRIPTIGKAEGGKGSMPFVGNSVKLDIPGSRNVHILIDPEAKATRFAGLTFTAPCIAEILLDGTLLVDLQGLKAIDVKDKVWKSRNFLLDGKNVIAFFPTSETTPNPTSQTPTPAVPAGPVNPPPVSPPPTNQPKEPLKLEGHSSFVVSLTFSRDGKTLVSGSFDNTAKVWDAVTGRMRWNLATHKGGVLAAALTSDGTTLATASEDMTVKIWDMSTGAEKATLSGHEGRVSSLAWATEGKALFSGSEDRTVKIWDVSAKKEVASFLGDEGSVLGIALSPDGKTLAVGGRNFPGNGKSVLGRIILWDVDSRTETASLTGHKGVIKELAISSDGNTLVSCSEDGAVKLWDLTTRKERATLEQQHGILRMAAAGQDNSLVTLSRFGEFKRWDLLTGKGQDLNVSFGGADTSMAISNDGRLIAVGGSLNLLLGKITPTK